MKIGITGATGHLGRLIVQQLKQKADKISLVALVRNMEKAKHLEIETRYFDYEKPESLPGPLADMDCLMLVSASEVGKRALQHRHVIEAAQQASVKRIVYTSLLHADNTSLNLGQEHTDTENLIKSTGISYTFLRNGWYTENYITSIQGAIAGGKLIGCAGDGKISSAARADYAEAAVAVLIGEGHQGKTYELAGDRSFTMSDLAAELSRQTGKNIPYVDLSETEYVRALTGLGVPEGFARLAASWDVSTSKGDLFETDKSLSKLIGHQTTPLSETIKKVLDDKQ